MKSCHLAKPWGPKDFFTSVGYPTHNLEGYVPYPESLILPPKPPPTERTVEDQPFCLVQKHPDDHRERVDITLGSFFHSCLSVERPRGLGQGNSSGF